MISKTSYVETSCIMEGFKSYLIENQIIRTPKYINIIRLFHNFVGKSYIDVNKSDVKSYIEYLATSRQLSQYSLKRALTAIRKFYLYLYLRGIICNNPVEGVKITHFYN